MSINQEQERYRSKSKKKGISVSLTPSKTQSQIEVSSFQVSRCTVNHINQLPKLQSQSSNSKNTQQVLFTYRSPHPFSPLKNQSNLESSEIKWPESAGSILRNDETYGNSNQKNLETTGFEYKSKSPERTKFEKRQIGASVFTVVQEISSKMTTNQISQKANAHQNESHQKSQRSTLKPQVKKTPTKIQAIQARQIIQKDLQIIPEKTIETSHQVSLTTKKYEGQSQARILRASQMSRENTNYSDKKMGNLRVERLKLAEQKLLNIIKVCDYGL